MLRITIQNDDAASVRLVLEGKLASDWIPEVLETWTGLPPAEKRVVVDLSAVSFVDAAGRRLLTEMHARGVQITGSGLMIRGLIEEITA